METANPAPDFQTFWQQSQFKGNRRGTFTVMTFNTLADCNVATNSYLYPTVRREDLDLETRSAKILAIVDLFNPDLLAFQEIDESNQYYQNLDGYTGHFKKKTGTKLEGIFLLWKTATFEFVELLEGEFKARDPDPTEYFAKDDVFILSVLKHKPTGRLVLFATTHIYFTKNRGDIQIAHLKVLLESIYRVASRHPGISILLCGDFNCFPNGGIYHYLSHQSLDIKNMPPGLLTGFQPNREDSLERLAGFITREMKIDPSKDHLVRYPKLAELQQTGLAINNGVIYPKFYPDCDYHPSSLLTHPLKLLSTCRFFNNRENFPTSIIANEKTTVDYIWYSNLQPCTLLMSPDFKYIRNLTGAPSGLFPSDHLPLVASYDFT